MKRVALGLLLLLTVLTLALPASATSITGDVAIAGVVVTPSFGTTGLHFANGGLAVVLMATGSLAPLMGHPVTLLNIGNFSTEAGKQLFHGNNGVTLDVVTDAAPMFVNVGAGERFLNWSGTAMVTESGFTPTLYDFSFTATKTDGLVTFTLDASTVPEPGSLLLVGTGLVGLAGLLFWKAKKPVATLRC